MRWWRSPTRKRIWAKPRLRGELKRTVFQLRLFAAEIRQGEHFDATIDHADPGWGMGPRPDLRRLNVPIGVVGVFGASNFPFAFSVMGGDSASALAAGCAVVHKAHDGHLNLAVRTAETVTAALDAAGAPSGLFSLVTGRPAAEALVDHPAVKAIGFTGSTAGGRALFNRAAARPEPIPFFGELGGINAVFVTEGAWAARREEILSGYAGSFTMGMGQFCTKPGLLFVPRGQTDARPSGPQRRPGGLRSNPAAQLPAARRLHGSLCDQLQRQRRAWMSWWKETSPRLRRRPCFTRRLLRCAAIRRSCGRKCSDRPAWWWSTATSRNSRPSRNFWRDS